MRALLLCVVVGLAAAGAATADHLDPQQRIRGADQKRAAAILLRKADLPSGFRPERTSDLEPHLTCSALDESDLAIGGVAKSPYWARDYQVVGSSAALYVSTADARTSWRRGTSAAGLNCLRDAFRQAFARQGETVRISIRRLALPKLAVAAEAHRFAFSGADPQQPLFYIDLVLLTHARALAGLLFAGVVTPPTRATEIALARVISQRMRVELRGAS
jgi:hypothetical protein